MLQPGVSFTLPSESSPRGGDKLSPLRKASTFDTSSSHSSIEETLAEIRAEQSHINNRMPQISPPPQAGPPPGLQLTSPPTNNQTPQSPVSSKKRRLSAPDKPKKTLLKKTSSFVSSPRKSLLEPIGVVAPNKNKSEKKEKKDKGKGKEKERGEKEEKEEKVDVVFLDGNFNTTTLPPLSARASSPLNRSISPPYSPPNSLRVGCDTFSSPSPFSSSCPCSPSASFLPPPPCDSPIENNTSSPPPDLNGMKSAIPAAIAPPSSETSKAYLALYYENIARSHSALAALKGLGVKSLETEIALTIGETPGMTPSIMKTISAINNGTLCLLTIGGSSDSGWALWKRWRDLLGDIFFFFEYSMEDGEGNGTTWGYFQRHDFNTRISLQDRLKFAKKFTISYNKVRRVELIHPLEREDKVVDDREKKKLTTSQIAYRTRKHIERTLALDTTWGSDNEDYFDDNSLFIIPHDSPPLGAVDDRPFLLPTSCKPHDEVGSEEKGAAAGIPLGLNGDAMGPCPSPSPSPSLLPLPSVSSQAASSSSPSTTSKLTTSSSSPSSRPRSVSNGNYSLYPVPSAPSQSSSSPSVPSLSVIPPTITTAVATTSPLTISNSSPRSAVSSTDAEHHTLRILPSDPSHTPSPPLAPSLSVAAPPTTTTKPTTTLTISNSSPTSRPRSASSGGCSLAPPQKPPRNHGRQMRGAQTQRNPRSDPRPPFTPSIFTPTADRPDFRELSMSLSSSEEDETSAILTISAAIETAGEGLLHEHSKSFGSIGEDESPLMTMKPLTDGDFFVRFFGMKDNDGFFTKGNLLVTHIPDGVKDKHSAGATLKKLKINSNGFGCHGGFYDIWEKIKRGCLAQHNMDTVSYIYSRWKRRVVQGASNRIVLVGHSMGACLTCIAAYQLVKRHPELKHKIKIINLGSPLFARKGFCEWIDKNIEVLNVCLVGDPTVALPGLPFTGWYAPGRRLWVSSKGVTLFDQPHAHFQYWELLRVFLLRF